MQVPVYQNTQLSKNSPVKISHKPSSSLTPAFAVPNPSLMLRKTDPSYLDENQYNCPTIKPQAKLDQHQLYAKVGSFEKVDQPSFKKQIAPVKTYTLGKSPTKFSTSTNNSTNITRTPS